MEVSLMDMIRGDWCRGGVTPINQGRHAIPPCKFSLPPALSLEQRENFTKALMQVRPLLKTWDAQPVRVLRQIESLLDRPVGLISRGPRAEDVEVACPEMSIDG